MGGGGGRGRRRQAVECIYIGLGLKYGFGRFEKCDASITTALVTTGWFVTKLKGCHIELRHCNECLSKSLFHILASLWDGTS